MGTGSWYSRSARDDVASDDILVKIVQVEDDVHGRHHPSLPVIEEVHGREVLLSSRERVQGIEVGFFLTHERGSVNWMG